MLNIGSTLGAVIRWLLKGCKTKLSDEIRGVFKGKLFDYQIENYFISVIFIIIVIIICLFIYS